MENNNISAIEKYPAFCVVHWSNGPVNCCMTHATQLIGLGNFMGAHTVATKLTAPAACENCINEAKNNAS